LKEPEIKEIGSRICELGDKSKDLAVRTPAFRCRFRRGRGKEELCLD
jgi:hypothetical protein